MTVVVSSTALGRLRALAAAGSTQHPPPLARHAPHTSVRASAVPASPAPCRPGRGSQPSPTPLKSFSGPGEHDADKLRETVRRLLDSGRPLVAAHLIEEEWERSGRCLEDTALSQELVVQLIRNEGGAAALHVLPMLASSPAMCAAAIRALQQRRNLQGVRAMLQHARETGAAAGLASRDVWRAVIVAFGQLGRPGDARRAFTQMREGGAWTPEDTHTVNLLLNALAGSIEVQFVRCNQLRGEGVRPDASTYNCLLKACMTPRDVKRADLVLRWMREDGVAADEITYNTLIKVFSYAGAFERVLGVRKLMAEAGFSPTPKLWGSLLLACGAAGQLEQAAILWWEMRQLHARHGGVLTADSTAAMMTACVGAGQAERALAAFEEARGAGVPLDTRAYNVALRACHTPGKTPRPEQLLHAFALHDQLKREGLDPDAYTFATLFTLCAAARQGRCALQLYEEMQGLGVPENVVVLTALIKAVGATPGLEGECLAILRRMRRGPARLKPNRGTFRTVIAALREAGDLAGALRVYQDMRRLFPADNREFEGLTAVAAERALSAEDADLRSAVAAVCGITSCAEVDLHGQSVLEARAAVLCTLALLQQRHREAGELPHDVTFITGRGKGSAAGEPVIRHEVARLLEALFGPLPQEALGAHAGRIVLPRQLVSAALQRRAAGRLKLPPPESPLHLRPRYQQQTRQRQGGAGTHKRPPHAADRSARSQ